LLSIASSERSVLRAFEPNKLGQPRHQAVADGKRRLRCDIAGGEAGTAGSDDQLSRGSRAAERGDDLIQLVGHDDSRDDPRSGISQQLGYRWPGDIDLLAGEAAVAGGDHHGGSAG